MRWEPTEESRSERVLHIGYVTPADEYAQVSLAPWWTRATSTSRPPTVRPTGTQAVGDVTWQRWETDDGRSLVLVDGPTADGGLRQRGLDELTVLAESLEPVASDVVIAASGARQGRAVSRTAVASRRRRRRARGPR